MKQWTVRELIDELLKAPMDAKVRLEDAETSWTIPKFAVSHDEKDNELWIRPCGYGDMV
jgi:hypothetical protein